MNWSAGYRSVELFDDAMAMPFPMVLLYPSDGAERVERLGPYELSVAKDGAIAYGEYPLLVISHGNGGSHLVYRTLGAHLARNGFVVAMPEHPRNNRNNNDLGGTVANLENRPRHVRLVMDWAFSELGKSLKTGAAAIIGHSLGGYTGLAVAGGAPTAFSWETPDQQTRRIDVTPDERVKALVLLAPAAAWFMAEGALSRVKVPILMLTAEKDPHTPVEHSEIIKGGVADRNLIEHRVVANAGHYSFLSPFPAAMVNPGFAPAQDPAGFDRVGFHAVMNEEVLAFLRRVM